MPDLKITQLVDGGAPQATDEFVIARAGDNFKVDFASIDSNLLSQAVILAPASSTRNVVIPTAGTVIAQVWKAHAAQSVDLTQWQTSAGVPLVTVGPTGGVTIEISALGAALTLVPFDNNESFTDTPSLSVPFAGDPAATARAAGIFIDPVINSFPGAPANLIEATLTLLTTINGAGGAQTSANLHGSGSLQLIGTPAGVPAVEVNDSAFNLMFEISRLGLITLKEQADPAAPAANFATLYVRDNGSGLTQWVVRFPTGAVYVLATEGDGAIYRVGGTDVAVADGGTGSSTAAGARTNLDVPSNAEAILDAIVDAKGDLIAGTAADTVARQATGTDFLETLTPDSSTSTGLRWSYKRSGLKPTSSLFETFSRDGGAVIGGGNVLVSQRLSMTAIDLPLGLLVTSISFMSAGTAASVPLNQLFGLYDSSRALLRGSNDDTTTAWAGNTVKTLALTSTFTTTYSGLHYLGILVVATTVPNIQSVAPSAASVGVPPIICGTSTTSVTALPNPAAAITASGIYSWAWVN